MGQEPRGNGAENRPKMLATHATANSSTNGAAPKADDAAVREHAATTPM